MICRLRICCLALSLAAAAVAEDGFVSLTDGTTFAGWKASAENPDTWRIEEGAFVTRGPRSHLFYVGDLAPFTNFEFKVEVRTETNANGGIYFHTAYQADDWPRQGFETQVNNTQGDPKRTGSLYGVVDVTESPARDNEWWTQHIIVQDHRIQVKVNGKTVVDYTEPPDRVAGKPFTRKLDRGTFALQAHDPGSVVGYRNPRVKRLD
ncbi:MAG: DUF1080 domain-containing protein [Verrucomicrobia bacterium]|nr:DUF1080 domain-containing protein [Verrucomicrobiota bacterium]